MTCHGRPGLRVRPSDMAQRDGRTALVVVVPEAQALYDAWRERWDPAPGIPAHVTLLFPFRPAELVDDALLAELRELFAAAAPFDVEFPRVGRFEEVAWLAPEPAEPFVALTETLVASFPEHPPYGNADFDRSVPHLTIVNRSPLQVLDEVARALTPELPIRSRVREATLLEEDEDGVWRTRAQFALGA
jgi:2'-5' RNA ligase